MEVVVERIMANQIKSLENKVLDVVKKTVASEVEKAMSSNRINKVFEKAAKDSAAVAAREATNSMQASMVTSFHQVCLLAEHWLIFILS
jgi:hypothetical protein